MAVKIRLRRMGAKKAPFYRIVVADSRYPRDGRFIEEVAIMIRPRNLPSSRSMRKKRKNGFPPRATYRYREIPAENRRRALIGERGYVMEELLVTIAKGLVEDKDAVSVTADAPDEEGMVVYHLHVGPDDMGRVIGKQGRIAKSIRSVMKAAATRQGTKIAVEID